MSYVKGDKVYGAHIVAGQVHVDCATVVKAGDTVIVTDTEIHLIGGERKKRLYLEKDRIARSEAEAIAWLEQQVVTELAELTERIESLKQGLAILRAR